MLALKHNCLHPSSNQPYILDSSGGRDNSPEGHQVVPTLFPLPIRIIQLPWKFLTCGLQGAFTHGFVSHFANDEDRKYYLEQDPAHKAFVASLDGIIQNMRIVDYEPGAF